MRSVGACVCGCGEDTGAGPCGSALKTNLHLEDAEKARRMLCLIQVQIGFLVVSESTCEPRSPQPGIQLLVASVVLELPQSAPVS